MAPRRIGLTLSVILLPLLASEVIAHCPPGCTCLDETRIVTCKDIALANIPMLLNPMLRSLTLVNVSLKPELQSADVDAINLYQELEYLNLANNGIVRFPEDFFVNLPKLKELHLQKNRLTQVDHEMLSNLDKLEKLDLSKNEISQLMPNAFAGNPELVFMDLSHNQLHFVLPAAFSGLSALRRLSLSGNRFSKLTADLFKELPSLEELSLNSNMLSQIPGGVFTPLNKLRALDLSSNVITTAEVTAFSGLKALKTLNLSINGLATISSSNWIYLVELEQLDLSRNLMTEIPAASFDGLSSLKELILSGLTELGEVNANAFAGLHSLEKLTISACPLLRKIHEHSFEHPTKVTHLDVRNNQLNTLNAKLLDWRQLTSLQIAGNPWHCDCSLLSVLASVPKEQLHSDANVAICSSPEDLLNRNVASAQSTFCTSVSEYAVGLLVVGSLIVTFSVVVLAFFCLRSRLHCCRSKGGLDTSHFRVPLYTAGSSFSGSLTYDKSDMTSSGSRSRSLPPPQGNAMIENSSDYYSSILLLPNSANVQSMALPPTYSMDAHSPYAIAEAPYLRHQRPPSFIAPPPPPSVPPPPVLNDPSAFAVNV